MTNSKRLHRDDHEHEAAFARSLSADMSFRIYVETNSQDHEKLTCIHSKSNSKHKNISFAVVTQRQAKMFEFLCDLFLKLSNDRSRRNNPLDGFVRGCLAKAPLHVRQGSHGNKQIFSLRWRHKRVLAEYVDFLETNCLLDGTNTRQCRRRGATQAKMAMGKSN
jgi:hypothetical protein